MADHPPLFRNGLLHVLDGDGFLFPPGHRPGILERFSTRRVPEYARGTPLRVTAVAVCGGPLYAPRDLWHGWLLCPGGAVAGSHAHGDLSADAQAYQRKLHLQHGVRSARSDPGSGVPLRQALYGFSFAFSPRGLRPGALLQRKEMGSVPAACPEHRPY